MTPIGIGCFWMFVGVAFAAIVGTSHSSREKKRAAYICSLVLYCMGALIAGVDVVKTQPNVSLLTYVLSLTIFGPLAVVLVGAAWSSFVSWLDDFVENGIERLLG